MAAGNLQVSHSLIYTTSTDRGMYHGGEEATLGEKNNSQIRDKMGGEHDVVVATEVLQSLLLEQR